MTYIHVVIPVYNAKQFLQETVASVLNQPCKGIDIVLVDDGSTDGSAALCDEIASREDRVSVIHQENGGVSVARNAGIDFILSQHTNGYIAFLDADDLWVDSTISEELISQLKTDIPMRVVCFGCTSSNADFSGFTYPLTYENTCKDGGNGVIWPMIGHFSANLYSVELLKKYGIRFLEGLKYCEDKIFKMQCVFLAEKVYYRPEIIHIYRENSTSAMRKVFAYSPIEYYLPIIDGWIASDDFVNSWESVTGKHMDAGRTLASIYFGDMSAEHYQRWQNRRELEHVCKQHPYFRLYQDMNPDAVSKKQYRDQQLHTLHPWLYRIKHRTLGLVLFAARLLLRTKPVYQFRQRRKYPLTSVSKGN